MGGASRPAGRERSACARTVRKGRPRCRASSVRRFAGSEPGERFAGGRLARL